jgi:hypothetical protein
LTTAHSRSYNSAAVNVYGLMPRVRGDQRLHLVLDHGGYAKERPIVVHLVAHRRCGDERGDNRAEGHVTH